MEFETKEPITLSEEMAKAFGFADTDTEQVEVAEEIAPVQEVVETEVNTELVQEETPTQEQQEEVEIPEISTQVVEQEKVKPGPEKPVQKAKVKIYKDNFQAALNKYYTSTESPDVEAFSRAWNSNYDNVEPIEMIRLDVLNDPYNKGMHQDAIDAMIEKRISEFNLDSDDERERRIGENFLRREANIIKDKLIKSGKEFVSQFESDLEIEVDAFEAPQEEVADEAALQAEREAKKQLYVAEFSKVIQNGVIQVTDTASGTVINIPVPDTGVIAEAAADPVGFITSKFLNSDGTVNYAKFAQFVNYSNNEDAVHSAWFKHGYTQATNKVTSQLKNKVDIGQPRPTEIQTEMTPFTHPLEFLQGAKVIRGGN